MIVYTVMPKFLPEYGQINLFPSIFILIIVYIFITGSRTLICLLRRERKLIFEPQGILLK